MILTDTVVRANEWARQLRTRPGVHVANTVDEVLAIISETGRSLDDILAGAFSDARA